MIVGRDNEIKGFERHDTGQVTLSGLMFFETETFIERDTMNVKDKIKAARFVQDVARDFGIVLSDVEALKHLKIIRKEFGDTNGQSFYDGCKEYFNN